MITLGNIEYIPWSTKGKS